MRGAIRFSNGEIVRFDANNYKEVISKLTDSQRHQLASILLDRMGHEPGNEFGIDEEIYRAWLDLTHRRDVKRGGGSRNVESKVNKMGKKLTRRWRDKGEAEKNLTLLFRLGFKRKWNKDVGYVYLKPAVGEVPIHWIVELDHERFQHRVKELMNREHQGTS